MLVAALVLACGLPPEPANTAPPPASTAPPPRAPVAPPAPIAADPLASMRSNPLRITRHGECRMACRQFQRAEVEDLLAHGTWMPERTRHDGPCPSHALEGTTADGQHARMVFAACDRVTKLVTAIDLDREYACDCD